MAGIQQVWVHAPPAPVKGKSLLESLGGVKALTHFVDVFYDSMLKDKDIAPVLKKSQQTQSEEVYMRLLKERTVEYLECVWGGDAWEGQDMFVAHAALHISTKTYDAAMKIAKNKINAMNMSGDAKKAMMEELWAMKDPMTDPDGKFHAWVHEKNKAIEKKMLDDGAVDLTGMGFTTSPAMVKAMKEKAEKEKQRKERMLAQKAKREAEEKERRQQERRERKAKEKAEKDTNGDGRSEGLSSAITSPRISDAPPDPLVEEKETPLKSSASKVDDTIVKSSGAKSKDHKHTEAKTKTKEKAKTKDKNKLEEEPKKDVKSMPLVIPPLPEEIAGTENIPESRVTPLLLMPLAACVA